MIEEKGPWAVVFGNGNTYIESDDFTHDAHLYVRGDFESAEQRVAYAEEIARRLNTFAEAQAEINEQARIIGMGGEREIDLRQQMTLLRNQVLEECAAIAEDTAAGRDAEAIADAIRATQV